MEEGEPKRGNTTPNKDWTTQHKRRETAPHTTKRNHEIEILKKKHEKRKNMHSVCYHFFHFLFSIFLIGEFFHW